MTDDDSTQLRWGNDGDAQANASGLDSLPLRQRRALGETFGGDRDLYDTLGYDKNPTVDDYWQRYLRQDLARTIVDAPAQTTWREKPDVTDDENDESQTSFEENVETLFREHELQARLDAVDRLAGIGHFGVLVMGFKDGAPLEEPVNDAALSGPDDLAYLMPIAEDRVDDWELVDDDSDERFGLPESYDIDFSNRDRLSDSVFDSQENVREVHHERVIHVPAGNTLDNVLMGRPRLEAVFNRLQDLEKVVGASSEAMWRAADYGLALQADAEHAGKLSDTQKENTEQELQKWYHGLQPFLRLSGFDVEKLDGDDVDPSGIFEALIKLIAGEAGIPQRILTGSERGELASTQDRASWLGRISERQTNFAEPKILRPLLDALVEFGVVAEPKGGDEGDSGREYEVEWPNLFELSDTEKAEIAKQKAQALKAARNPNSAQPIMSPGEIRAEVFDMDPELGAEVDIDENLPGDGGDGDDPLADLLPPEDAGPDSDEGDAPSESGDDDTEVDENVREQFEQSDVSDLLADGGHSSD